MRKLAKTVFNFLGLLAALPYIAWAWLPLAIFGSDGSYGSAAYALAIVPGFPGTLMRRAFYCVLLPKCHWDLDIGFGSVITRSTARLGKRVLIGAYASIGWCDIGDYAMIGSRTSLLSGRHQHKFDRLDVPIADQEVNFEEIRIGADTMICESCIVMADVGSGCVVGAGAVVVHPVEDRLIVAGNPARRIGSRAGDGEPDVTRADVPRGGDL
jgi:carbonic anhydrase/acetyltransferase-like protein (isoleucine patch superfamily)